ncbi:HNH endonuclease [Nocardia wallacei]|uniref:HNH endonuclease n=1 Tax=Nocardia wallacei TaxID=480035 RepID=UPI0024580031|nr:HNH endonuclease [Nocardia wallacei]
MPKAPRRCPADGCANLIRGRQYCEAHTKSWAVPSGWQRPANWDRDRAHVLRRDRGICHICGKPGADTVDHITPQSQGGRDHPDNYAAIHDDPCHRIKTNQERTRAANPGPRGSSSSGRSATFDRRTHFARFGLGLLRPAGGGEW